MILYRCHCGEGQHTTHDHGVYGRGECLRQGCQCPKMDPKEEWVPKKGRQMTREEHVADAKEFAKTEKDLP